MDFLLLFLQMSSIFMVITAQSHLIEIMTSTRADAEPICAGAKFNNTAAVVPASCISTFRNTTTLGIRRRLRTTDGERSITLPVLNGTRHPCFIPSNPNTPNIGFIQYRHNDELSRLFQPRNLTKLPDIPTLCLLTGWLQRSEDFQQLYTDVVQVLPPAQCGINNLHTHCSIFPIADINNLTCRFGLGSSLSCDQVTTAGIVTSDSGCEIDFTEQNGILRPVLMLRYTSMSYFNDWQNSGRFLESSNSVMILIMVLCAVRNFMK